MRDGRLRCEDYAHALLEQARRCAHLNAFIAFEPEAVLEAARAADRSREAGRGHGLLHGLAIPIKDSVNTRGLPTTNGTRALRGFRPRADAQVVQRLAGQGAIVMGKTNLQELSRGWTSNNGAFGAVLNAYDPTRVPGGSSGGSATAVAARIAPLAVAEDTWGSIRVPAAMCGVAGLRPTVGHYPNAGIMPLTLGRFDQVGPVARSVADLALFDAAVRGLPAPVRPKALAGVRLGIPQAFLEGLDPEVARVTESAYARLADAGAVMVRVNLPREALACADIAGTIIARENIEAISAFLAAEAAGVEFEALIAQASPNIRSRYDAGPPSLAEYEAALAARMRVELGLARLFEEARLDALAFPPLLAPAPPLGDNAEVDIAGRAVPLREVVGRNTALGNCGNLSSLVLPAGMTADGLPVGLEFDGPSGSDASLLALGFALELALGPIPPPALAVKARN